VADKCWKAVAGGKLSGLVVWFREVARRGRVSVAGLEGWMGCGISAMVWCKAWCLVRASGVQMAAWASMLLCINLSSMERFSSGGVARVAG